MARNDYFDLLNIPQTFDNLAEQGNIYATELEAILLPWSNHGLVYI